MFARRSNPEVGSRTDHTACRGSKKSSRSLAHEKRVGGKRPDAPYEKENIDRKKILRYRVLSEEEIRELTGSI